jgi:hypothetical protein
VKTQIQNVPAGTLTVADRCKWNEQHHSRSECELQFDAGKLRLEGYNACGEYTNLQPVRCHLS